MGQEGIYVVVVAAGMGTRAKRPDDKHSKQYIQLQDKAILWHSLKCFDEIEQIQGVLTVIHRNDLDLYTQTTHGQFQKLLPAIVGGDTRQASVYNGLVSLKDRSPKTVIIHDAVRPFCSAELIQNLIHKLNTNDAVIPVLPVNDSLKELDGDVISGTVSREKLSRAQTPQCFDFDLIMDAHKRANSENQNNFTDDASIAEWSGMNVICVQGEETNFKITTVEDIIRAEQIMEQSSFTRVGQGFDVHAFTEGDELTLCGVKLKHDKALAGHSDADVGLHAITDALFGALAEGDIGIHFPPSDPQWAGADSSVFLQLANERVLSRGGKIINIDVTLICELPKIGPHAIEMRNRIAEILNIEANSVNVKATTSERLGFTGRGEGIAAMAIATIQI